MTLKRMLPVLLLGIVLWIQSASMPCLGQEPNPLKDTIARSWWNYGPLGFRFDGLGNPVLHGNNGGQYRSYDHLALFALWDDAVLQALDLDPSVVQEIKAILTEVADQISAGQRVLPDMERGMDGSRESNSRSDALTQVCDEIKGRLTKSQIDRWDQLIIREWIQNMGWRYVLQKPEVRNWLDLDPGECERLDKTYQSLQKEIREEVKELEGIARNRLLGILPPSARRNVETVFENENQLIEPELDLLISNLGLVQEMAADVPASKLNGDRKQRDAVALGRLLVASEPVFSRRRVGHWDIHRFPYDRIPDFDLASELLMKRSVQQYLELTPDQITALNHAFLDKRKIGQNFQQGLVDEATGIVAAELQEPAIRRMLNVLLPHQKREMTRIVLIRQIRMIGLPQLMLDGRITGDALDARQREKLIQTAAALHDKLTQRRAQLIERVEDEILDALNHTHRKKLKRHIGAPAPFFGPSIDLLRIQLELASDEDIDEATSQFH